MNLAVLLALATLPASPVASPADTVTWQIDVTHSELTFRIRHFVSRVRGRFGQWSGTIVADPQNLNAGSVEVTIQATSIDTGNERRDADLRSANFFLVDSFPTITFKSTKVGLQGSTLRLTGDLTIKGITKPVVLEGEFNGFEGAAAPRQRIGFSVATTVNRLDWGITWNRVAEGGGVMLGDQVVIDINISAVRQ